MFFQLLVGVYGGYFGAGIGILMLAALSLMGHTDIHQMNGLKNILAADHQRDRGGLLHLGGPGGLARRPGHGGRRHRRRRLSAPASPGGLAAPPSGASSSSIGFAMALSLMFKL